MARSTTHWKRTSRTIAALTHPIVQGISDFTIKDEAFFLITWAKSPEISVLATAPIAATKSAGTHKGEVVPQIWTYERTLFPGPGSEPYRAFVWMQGTQLRELRAATGPDDVAALDRVGEASVPDALMTERPRAAPGTRARHPSAPGQTCARPLNGGSGDNGSMASATATTLLNPDGRRRHGNARRAPLLAADGAGPPVVYREIRPPADLKPYTSPMRGHSTFAPARGRIGSTSCLTGVRTSSGWVKRSRSWWAR